MLPLSNKRILVTRPPEQSIKFSSKLKERGAEVIAVPVVTILPPLSWSALDNALQNISNYEWVIFASGNAVRAFLSRSQELSLTNWSAVKFAAVGSETSALMEKAGIVPAYVPSQFIAEQFIKEFPNKSQLKNKRILWPKGNLGRQLIADELEACGAIVDSIETYRSTLPEDPKVASFLYSLVVTSPVDAITFTSGQSVHNFLSLFKTGLKEADTNDDVITVNHFLSKIVIGTIGPQTSKAAQDLLGKVSVQADPYTTDGLISALEQYFLSNY